MVDNPNPMVFVKITDLKVGDVLIADDAFDCLCDGQSCTVKFDSSQAYKYKDNNEGWYVDCAEGKHWLCGQCDDGEIVIGFATPDEYNLWLEREKTVVRKS